MASNDIPTIVHEPSLLGIPSELRLRIFEHVFPGLRIHYANPTGLKLDGIPEEEFRWVTEHKYNIGVLTVCKNLSREASAVFASSLSLSVRMRENLVWSQTIVQYSSYIRSLEINLTEFFGEDIELSIFPHLQVLVLDCDTFEGEGFGDFSTIEAYQEVLEGSVDEKVKENFKAFMLARPWISRVHEQPSRSFRILLIAHQYLSPRLLKPRAGAWMRVKFDPDTMQTLRRHTYDSRFRTHKYYENGCITTYNQRSKREYDVHISTMSWIQE